jgi:hypothetical protein
MKGCQPSEIADTETGDKMNQDQNHPNAPPSNHRSTCHFDLKGP